MKKRNEFCAKLLSLTIGIFSVFYLTSNSYAYIFFYVDPDWAGAESGTETKPWTSLDWKAINTALASDDVTVYFSARETGSDINESTTTALILSRTDSSKNRLTLDGMSYYNTNDSNPSWSAYSGKSRFEIKPSSGAAITTGSNVNGNSTLSTPRNYITLRGLKANGGRGAQAIIVAEFNHSIIEYCEITHQPGATTGPGLLITTNYRVVPSSHHSHDLIIRNNEIHDTYGECLYVSGCYDEEQGNGIDGCVGSQTELMADIQIIDNTIYDCGVYGASRDAIDIKDGTKNVVIDGNYIYSTLTVSGADQSGIVMHNAFSQINGNFIDGSNFKQACIQLHDGYDTYFPDLFDGDNHKGGGVISNNVFAGCSNASSAASWVGGIFMYSNGENGDYSNIHIYNNTIYGAGKGNGINISSNNSGIDIVNNIVTDSAGTELNASAGTLGSHDYNLYYDTSGNIYTYGSTSVAYHGNLSIHETNSLSTAPSFVSKGKPFSASNFTLQAYSDAIDTGTIIFDISDDFFGNPRPANGPWSMGAIQN